MKYIKYRDSENKNHQSREQDNHIRVLHVDDSEAILKISKIFIERYGMGNIRVDSLIDPSQTLDKLKLNEYDIIISDHYMSKINGFDVFKEIRKANIMTPFIILTGMTKREEINTALRSGVDDVFTKDAEAKSLYKKLVYKIFNIVNRTNDNFT